MYASSEEPQDMHLMIDCALELFVQLVLTQSEGSHCHHQVLRWLEVACRAGATSSSTPVGMTLVLIMS